MSAGRWGRTNTVERARRLKVLPANTFSPSQTTVQQARWPAMKVHDGMKAPCEQPRRKGQFARSTQNFINIRIAIKAVGELRFHQNRDAEFRKLCLQCANRSRQQQAIAHGTEANEKDAGLRGKTIEKLFS